MQLRLTRKLISAVLLSSCMVTSTAFAAEPDTGLSSAEQGNYLLELKRLYLTENDRQALLAHCNDLLTTYALRAAYQVGQAQRQDLLYQVALGGPGELVLREETRAEQGSARAVRNQRLSVFGLDPYIRYDCPATGSACVPDNPAHGRAR